MPRSVGAHLVRRSLEPPPSLSVRHRGPRRQGQGAPTLPAPRRGDALREAQVAAERRALPQAGRDPSPALTKRPARCQTSRPTAARTARTTSCSVPSAAPSQPPRERVPCFGSANRGPAPRIPALAGRQGVSPQARQGSAAPLAATPLARAFGMSAHPYLRPACWSAYARAAYAVTPAAKSLPVSRRCCSSSDTFGTGASVTKECDAAAAERRPRRRIG